MITSLPPQPPRSTPPKAVTGLTRNPTKQLAADYRLLGLRPREARVEVIRDAVHQAARSLHQPSSQEDRGEDGQLTEIAVAGYRLLDPRRRRTLFERVQLLMWTEEELDVNVKSLWSAEVPKPPQLKIAIKPRRASGEPSAEIASDDENQVALELFKNLRKRDRRALALWIGVASITASLATALMLFAFFAR